MSFVQSVRSLHTRLDSFVGAMPACIALLALRLALAIPFWRSGQTKWDGFLNLSAGARYLFEEEFKLHLLGQTYSYPAPLIVAHLTGIAEIVLPILLVLGLFTRYAAVAILAMTIVIQVTVPDGLINFHLPWAAMALALMHYGGGLLSLDRLIARYRPGPVSIDAKAEPSQPAERA